MTDVLLIGCGFSGSRIAATHVARGERVTVATRSGNSNIAGTWNLKLDLDGAGPVLPQAARVYYTVPPPSGDVHDPRLARLLDALPPPAMFVYFSSTAVYGDRAGARVDESCPPAPGSDRGRRRLDAERQTGDWCDRHGAASAILRIAAIYGPGRLPLTRLRAGEPVPDDAGPGNRIHVDDLAAAAIAIADQGLTGTWNASDGNPLSVADFNDLVADAAGLPRPRRVPRDSPEISPGMRGFLQESRWIDNGRLLAVPGFRLRYPDPADGILHSLQE